MNKKIALILACCAATSFAACNETTEWNFTESCGTETKRCVESTIQVCKDGVWVPEVTCEGATPWCDVTTHTCIAKPAAKDCQDGAQKCDQNAVWTCKNGKWEKTTDCNEGDKTCNSTTYVCDPKAQPEVTCDHNGIKLAVGATVCDGETTLKTCTANADGTTAELKSAPCADETPVCDANACRAYNKCAANGADVEHNATVCDGDVSKKCNDGTLETVKDCAAENPAQVCLTESGECGDAPATACTDTTVGTVNDGENVCKDNNLWTCDNTQLSQTKACTVTADDTSKSFVATCIAASGDTAAHCDKKCAEDTALNEAGDACEPIDGKDDICRVNNNVAQAKHFSFGQFSDWTDCSDAEEVGTPNATEYACNEAGDACIVKSCAAGYRVVKDDNGKYTCEHEITNNCKDSNNAPVELDEYICLSDTQVGVCQAGENYTATVVPSGSACDTTKGMVCDSNKVGTLLTCACTEQTPSTCNEQGGYAKVSKCNTTTGKIEATDCAKNGYTKSTTCNQDANACGKPICKDGYVVANGICGKCNVEGAESCGVGKICSDKGKCVDGEEPACTTDSCIDGMFKKCVDADGAKKYADPVSCIENGVGICAEDGTACTTDVKSCNVNYMKVEDTNTHTFTCKKYDTVECTTGVCTDSYYFGCPAATAGEAKRYHSAPVAKPAVDANGTWACNAAEGWKLTCTDTDLYEVKDGKCTLNAGKCIADTDCSGETPKCNVASNTCVAAPATECTAGAIQCVSDAKYKTCTAEDTWGAETDVATGLKCDTTANKLICKDDAAKTCNGTKVMGCNDGKLNQEIQDCATNTDDKKTCSEGACVARGGTTPVSYEGLIISEILNLTDKGGHQLGAVEIFNTTSNTISANACNLIVKGSKEVSIPISGDIQSNGTYVVCTKFINEHKVDEVDYTPISVKTKCNTFGLDGFGIKWNFELKCNNTTIDYVGKKNQQAADGDIKFNNVKANHLIRKCGILAGVATPGNAYDYKTQWEGDKVAQLEEGDVVNFNVATLGTHKAVCDTPVE